MKQEEKYRIIKREWFNEQAQIEMERWLVQKKINLPFGLSWWKTFKHEVFSWNGLTTAPLDFRSFGDAHSFVHRLKAGYKISTTVDTVDAVLEFEKE